MRDTTTSGTSADYAIALMDRAAEANVNDPFRNGLLIELPAEGEIMVTGDLHGRRANFRRIVKIANLPRCRARHLVLQELVHELERDVEVCRSYRLVELAAQLKQSFPRQAHILPGNHEVAELLGLAIGKRNRELNYAFDEGGREAYRDDWPCVKDAYRRFWLSCPLAIRTDNRIFISHSTPGMGKAGRCTLDYLRHTTPQDALQRATPAYDMLWGRDYSPASADAFAELVDADVLIVGHTPCDDGMDAPNRRHVILDCKDHEGRYAILPLDRPLTQEDVVSRAKRLYD